MHKKNDLTTGQFGVIAITLMALALGGATELVAQAVIAALCAVLIVVAPPQHALGKNTTLLFLAAFVISLAAFLPADWASPPAWRHHLVDDLQLALPGTRTPQPWLTAQSCCLFFVGLVWAYYVLCLNWNGEQRLQAAFLLVLGVAGLAGITVWAFVTGHHIPGWNQEQNRGWFPNRNQTADVLALGGIVNYALVVDRLRKFDRSGFFWLAMLVPISAGLVVSYSRAGVMMFFAGICLWHLWSIQSLKSTKWTMLGLTLVFTLLTFFFLFGGETLDRFLSHHDSPTTEATPPEADFRISVQSDALRFSLQSPVLGIGLGNFEALFAAARQSSVEQNRAIHPESDWLWMACEMGWLAPLLFLAGIVWWLRQCFPFEVKRGESLRRAMAVAFAMFLVHGLVDVSGHRVGSMWFAILLAALTRPDRPERADVFDFPFSWSSVPSRFRGMTVFLFLIAAWWFAAINAVTGTTTVPTNAPSLIPNFGINRFNQDTPEPTSRTSFYLNQLPPTTADLADIKARIAGLMDDRKVGYMEQFCTAALAIAPLDWTLYFQRAYAEVFQPGKLRQASADFQVARALEPHWAKLCVDEGAIWLEANQPDLCMDAWQDALRRAGTKRGEVYREMLRQATSNPLVRDDLGDLAADQTGYLMVYLNEATPDETKKAVSRLLTSDPDLHALDDKQRETLFANWWQKGDQADLTARLLARVDWQKSGWPWLAQAYAKQNDFQKAWETVTSHSEAPPLPAPASASSQPIEDLERSFYGRPDNTAAGLMLASAEIKQGKVDDALATLRALEKIDDRPPYVFYLEAQLWGRKQQWELAWEAWQKFDPR